jgi:hypothetical protein
MGSSITYERPHDSRLVVGGRGFKRLARELASDGEKGGKYVLPRKIEGGLLKR